MKVSLNTLQGISERYKCADNLLAIGKDKLIAKIGTQLGGIDEVIDLGSKYQRIVIVKVISCEPHPDADKLKVCTVDNGKEKVQVVCGAPNVKEGVLAAWLPPGAAVPETIDKEPFKLEAREIRGVVSNGMLASPKELGLGDSHEGLLVIDGDHEPGTDFAEAFGLKDDVVLDIENKMFTHRPDLFGFLGIARELAGIQQMPFKSPDWYVPDPSFPAIEGEPLPLIIKNELPDLVPRFTAITMSDVTVGPSPTWLQVELAKVGQKSINNIVDYTNWFMLETGQPLHAYDYDKVKALSQTEATIVVRKPKAGEKVKLLNGKEIELGKDVIAIATDKQLIGIGGVMGGTETEVDVSTKNIILECANFDMYSVRRTSMTHGLFTDAVTRFTKGQSPLQNKAVLFRIVDEIHQSGGKVASEVIDSNHANKDAVVTQLNSQFINDRLGLELSSSTIKTLLENVEFEVGEPESNLTAERPFWRTDIEIAEDIVEEVGRLYGYDKLPLELPKRVIEPTRKDPLLTLKAYVRERLSKAGANEILTYSFVPSDLLNKVGQDKEQAFQIANALSPDLQYYRLSLLPSLLGRVHQNIKAGYDEFALFELGKSHVLGEPDQVDPAIPKEVNALSFVYTSKSGQSTAYYHARKYLINLLQDSFYLNDFIKLEPLAGADLYNNSWIEQMVKPFNPNRSAVLRDDNGLIWGVVGEFKPSVRRTLKLPDFTAGFEIDPLLLWKVPKQSGYTKLSRFPKVWQDITFKVLAELPFQELHDTFAKAVVKAKPEQTLVDIKSIDIYQSSPDNQHKNVTLRLEIASYERTLTDQEVNKLLDEVAAAIGPQLHAERV